MDWKSAQHLSGYQRLKSNKPLRGACHECAHGVVHAVMDWPFIRLELGNEDLGGNLVSGGRCIVEPMHITEEHVTQEITSVLAGFAFEKLVRPGIPVTATGSLEASDDLQRATSYYGYPWVNKSENIETLLVKARNILLKNWDWMLRAGEQLMKRGALTYEEFLKLRD